MRHVAIVLVAGLMQAASIASPWGGAPSPLLQVASLALLAKVLRCTASPWRGAFLAWLFATSWLAGTWWWLYISMHVYGGLAAPLAALAVLALAAFLSLYYGLAGAIAVRAQDRPRALQALVFAAAWLLAELLRATLFTGFPWGAGGYAHTDGPLAAFAPWIGVYGIGFIAAWLAWWATVAIERPRVGGRCIAIAALVLAALAGAWWHHDSTRAEIAQGGTSRPPLSVALLQGNIPQDEKFESNTGVRLALQWYAEELVRSTATLVVTPETAIPLLPSQLPEGYLDAMRQRFAGSRTQAALVGIPLGGFAEGYANAVHGYAPGQPTYRYDKHHLVPFGEFIPPLFKWFVRLMNIPLGDFNRGAVGQPPLAWSGERIAPNICYEDLFGEEIGVNFADAAQAPTVLVNVSNIGWFGDTVAIDQHLQISRMRALEFERPVIRATNTGATAIIDAGGRVAQSLPRFTRGVLTGTVRGRDSITPYAAWVSRFGLLPLWILAVAFPLAVLRRRK